MADYKVKNTAALLRLVRVGEIVLCDWEGKLDTYSPKITTDASLNRDFGKFMLTVGANNIFNVYPNKFSTSVTESGGAWDPVQMGHEWGVFYTKLK